MSRSRELGRSILSTLASQGVSTAVSIAFLVYFARKLPKSEMAVYAYSTTLLNWIHLFAGLGLATLTVREVPGLVARGMQEEANRLISTMVFWRTAMGLLVMVVLLLLAATFSRAGFESEQYTVEFYLLAVLAFMHSVLATMSLMQWAMQRFHIRAICTVVDSLGSRVFAVAGYLTWGIRGFLLGFIAGSLIAVVVSGWNLRREWTWRFHSLWSTLKRSKAYIGVDALRNLVRSVDQPAIGFILGDQQLANYFVAKRLYDFAMTSVNAVVGPTGAKLGEVQLQGPRVLGEYFDKSMYLMTILFIPAGCVMIGLGRPMLYLLGGEKYLVSVGILAGFGLATMTQAIYLMWYEGVYRLLPGRYLIWANVWTALATFGLYAAFLPLLQEVGIPVANGVAALLVCIWSAVLLRRKAGLVTRWDPYMRASVCGLAVLAAIWLVSLVSGADTWPTMVAMCLAAGVTYVGVFLCLAPPEARQMLERIAARLLPKRRAA